MAALIDQTGEELAQALCSLLEVPPVITARDARRQHRNFQWVSCCDFHSPGFWWVSEIDTDHGPPSDDNKPVRWKPRRELTELIEVAWTVVDEMKNRGWLFHILEMVDGWVVNGKRYKVQDGDWKNAVTTSDFVQEIGDTAPEAICRAAMAAVISRKE